MIYVGLFFLLTVISGSQAYSKCPNFQENVRECTRKYITSQPSLDGLLDTSKPITVDSVMNNKLTQLCTGENKKLLKRFFVCIYLNLKQCMPAKFLPAFPAQTQYEASIDYMCDNARDLDVPCMTNKKDYLLRCVKERAQSVAKQAVVGRHMTTDDYIEIICRAYPAAKPCYKSAYGQCSGRTEEIFLQVYKIQIPTACADDTTSYIEQQATNTEDSTRVQLAFKHHGHIHNSIYEAHQSHGVGGASTQTASLCCLLLALASNWIRQTYL